MLARYGALLVSGAKKLPSNIADITAREAEQERLYFNNTPNLNTLIDYTAFMESLSKLVGCRPKMPNPFLKPSLFFKYWTWPSWACWYRKDGQGNNYEAFASFLSRAKMNNREAMPLLVLAALLMLICLPGFILYRLIRFLGLDKSRGLGLGWMWMRPKDSILHNSK